MMRAGICSPRGRSRTHGDQIVETVSRFMVGPPKGLGTSRCNEARSKRSDGVLRQSITKRCHCVRQYVPCARRGKTVLRAFAAWTTIDRDPTECSQARSNGYPQAPAQANQSTASARNWTWTIRLIKAEEIGLTIAASWARFPAPTTTVPVGSSNSPIRRSLMSE